MTSWIRAILGFILGFGGARVSEAQVAQMHHAAHKSEIAQNNPAAKKHGIQSNIILEKQEILVVRSTERTDEQIIKDAQALIRDLEERARQIGHRSQELATVESLLRQITNEMHADTKKREELIATLRQEMNRDKTEAALIAEAEHAKSPAAREQDQKAIAQEELAEDREEKKEQQLELELDNGSGI